MVFKKGDKLKRDISGKNNPNYGKRHPGINKHPRPDMIGKNNPMFKRKDTSGKNYFYEDLGHRCRSSWEVNYARILKYLDIDYKYEPTSFKLKEGDSYTPDFFLKKENKYIEIKGFLTKKFLNKFERFKKQYFTIKIELIDEKKYLELKEKYFNKIEYESSSKAKQNYKFKEVEIESIKKTCYSPKKVYNLEIEEDNSFIVNGIVVHNTSPHITSAENLKGWSRRVLHNENAAYAVMKAIAKRGTEAQPFFRPSLDQVKTIWVPRYFNQILGKTNNNV